MRIATAFALITAAEAAKCRLKCSDPFKVDKDICECLCKSGCEEWQEQNGDDCSCADKPCAEACAAGEGGTATAADFVQAAQPSCECSPADGKDPCDAIYGGKWTTQADGTACPAGGDDAGEGDAGEGDAGEGEGSGATQLLASAMVLAASLLI